MDTFDASRRPDPRQYMRYVASTDQGRHYKTLLLEELDLRPGQTALDVGCGPGTDLNDLAAGVTGSGSVLGVDNDPAMVREATVHTWCLPQVDIRLADAHHLPVPSATVDRIKVDRTLQHVASPVEVLRELRRVCRAGAVVVLAEPDWATLAIDSADLATSAAFTSYTCNEVVRNPSVGRQMARLGSSAGFEIDRVRVVSTLFDDFAVADLIFGMTRNSAAAVESGRLGAESAEQWLLGLQQGPFLAAVLLFVAVLSLPS
jgi:ubiquinone/menaquinone biosynthesis C-methylase UbiE